MKRFRFIAAAAFVLFAASINHAHAAAEFARVVATCGTVSPTDHAGDTAEVTMDVNGKLCVNSTVTASLTGSTSNTSSGVATSSSNLSAVSYLYGFNGATWDQLQVDTSKNLKVNVTNTNANGRATAANSSPVVQPSAPSTWHLIAAASTNATSVKPSAAVVFSCQLANLQSTPVYLKIYNKASAPTVGTDTPVKTLIVPVNSTAANGAGSNIPFGPGGLALGTGFAAAVTAGITDADTTAVSASSVAINCDYE